MPSADSLSDDVNDSFVDISEKQDRGILKKVVRKGTSDIRPCPGDTVIVHYVGTYYGGEEDGQQFDSSRDRNSKFEFIIGKGDVITAWDIGVATMQIGEISELIASPEYAYKDDKSMKFEIELFETKGSDVSENQDGSVRKSIIEKGLEDAWSPKPTMGLEAEISYKLIGAKASVDDIKYIVGDPCPYSIPKCVDLAVRNMTKRERCRVRCSLRAVDLKETAGDTGPSELIYEVYLKSFEKLQHLSSLSDFCAKMEFATTVKLKANNYVKESKYDLAKSLYNCLVNELDYALPKGPEEQKAVDDMKISYQLNLALVFLKMGDYKECKKCCKEVLKFDQLNEKALYRIGQAYLLRKDYEGARSYFKNVVEHNPKNASAVAQLNACEAAIKASEEKERKLLRGAFQRLKERGLYDESDNAHPVASEECSVE